MTKSTIHHHEELRALYLSYDGMTDHLGQSQVLAYLRRLSSQNLQFFLISFEKSERYRAEINYVKQMLSERNIRWYPKRYTKYPLFLSTLRDLFRCLGKSVCLHRRHRFHVVHCRSHTPAIIGILMKKVFGVKFIFDMRGWWIDEKFESGHWDRWVFKLAYYILKWLEYQFLIYSDQVVVLTQATREELLKSFPDLEEKITVIPTCVDFKVFGKFNYRARNHIRSSLGISQDTQVLAYSGSFGGNYDIENLVRLFQVFLNCHPSGQFIVLSKTDPELISDMLDSHAGIPGERILLMSVEYREVHEYLSAADFGVILYQDGWSLLGRSPTKLGEYWACGLSVLGQRAVGDLSHLEKVYPYALSLFDNFDEESLTEAMQKMPSDRVKIKLKQAAEEYFGINNGVHSYQGIYSTLGL